jgi:hypothetical protein
VPWWCTQPVSVPFCWPSQHNCWVLLLMYSHDTNLVCWVKLSLWHPPYCWALMKSMAYCGSWSQPSMLLLKVPQHVHDWRCYSNCSSKCFFLFISLGLGFLVFRFTCLLSELKYGEFLSTYEDIFSNKHLHLCVTLEAVHCQCVWLLFTPEVVCVQEILQKFFMLTSLQVVDVCEVTISAQVEKESNSEWMELRISAKGCHLSALCLLLLNNSHLM